MTPANIDAAQHATTPGTQCPAHALTVDPQHPFFFDHPLDHVPGLLLIDGMFRLSRSLAERGAPAGSVSLRGLDIEFSRYCLMDSPVELRCQELDSPTPSHVIEVWQDGTHRARGRYEWGLTEAAPVPTATGRSGKAEPAPPCDRNLVGKTNPVNVMIGAPWFLDNQLHAGIVPPHPENGLVETPVETYAPLYLLEAFMQTQRYLNQLSSMKKPTARMRDTLVGVSIHLLQRIAVGTPIGIVRPPNDIASAATGRRRQAGQIAAWRHDADKPLLPIQPLAECVVHTLSVC